MINHWK